LRAAVFGSGLMGSAIAQDLVSSNDVDQVTVYDVDRNRLNELARTERSSKLSAKVHDVRRVPETVKLLRAFDVGIGALPHDLCEYAIKSSIQAGVNFVDLIFGWRYEETKVHAAAKRKGITIVPACGLAPGLSNILAMAGAEAMDRVDEVRLKVGGIPEKPKPPLNYRIVFSFEAVLEEYFRKACIVKNGKPAYVPALSGLETVRFPPPIGECECFYTDGLSTLIRTMKGVKEMDEKTIRWPGHVAQIQTLIECGLLDESPVKYDDQLIVPRRFVARTISDRIQLGKEKDLTLLRVDVKGRTGSRRVHQRYEMIDHYDTKNKITSMARTTAFPCSIAAQLLASGAVAENGLVPPELAFQGELREKMLRYISKRGIKITGNKA
jgi:lysine 6-dehydrogenase